jgi:hypothetical protein
MEDPLTLTAVEGQGASGEGSGEVQSAALNQVLVEGTVDLIEEAGTLPHAVVAVAGLPFGGGTGEAVPGFPVGNLPEDGVEDEAQVGRRATRGLAPDRGCSLLGRGSGEEGFDQGPLFDGQVDGAPP